MTEIINSIYKKKSHKKLKLVLEVLYAQYQRSKNKHISASELARNIKKDPSGTGTALKKLKKDGIVDVKCPEKEDGVKKGGRIKILYRLSQRAHDIINKQKPPIK